MADGQRTAESDPLAGVYCRLLNTPDAKCFRPAVGWLDGVTCCVECADAWLDRDAAERLNVYAVGSMPDLEPPR